MWVKWREIARKSPWIGKEAEEEEVVFELAEFMAYCGAVLGNQETTIRGKLVAVSFYHQQFRNMSLPLGSTYIKGVGQGIKRKHVEMGTQQKVRRPLTWGMLCYMQEEVGAGSEGGRVLWLGLAMSYFLLLRASELFAEKSGKIHGIYGLRRGDVAFFAGETQLTKRERHRADKMEVHMRGSKGDQARKGAVLVRVKKEGGGAVDLMLELLSIYEGRGVDDKSPLMAYTGGSKWEVWRREEATRRMRGGIQVVARKWSEEGRGAGARLNPKEFALHSGRIGGATRLAARGVPEAVIKKEGRWASDSFLVYVRANMRDPELVSAVLEEGKREYNRQPGQGTDWGM